MTGKLYGIGVGPGDPELLTLKAVRIIKECDVIAVPGKEKDETVAHTIAFEKISKVLDSGKNVAFLTLGDPCIYSTYIYVHQKVEQAGYETEIVSGIPSFCAVSARLNQGLVERNEMLHVIPSSYGIEEGMKLSGTRVLMKAGKKWGKSRSR